MRIKNFLPQGKPLHKTKLLLSLLLGLVLSTFFVPTVQGQIYVASKDKLAYYNVATNTWVAKTGFTSTLTVTAMNSVVMANAKRNLYMHAITANGTIDYITLIKYSPETDTWDQFQNLSAGTYQHSGNIVITNSTPKRAYITYENIDGKILKYFEVNSDGTFSSTGNLPPGRNEGFDNMVYDDANFIYKSIGTVFKKYDYMTNVLTTLAPIPANSASALVYTNLGTSGKIFALGNASTKFLLSSYDIATDTWTELSDCPAGNGTGLRIVWDGANALYVLRNSDGAFWKYDIITATWTTLPTENIITTSGAHDAFGYFLPKCEPEGTVTSTWATCNASGVANSNASITLATYGGGVTKVGYSVGTTYTGPAFASATPVTAAPMVLSSTLPNPPTDQTYTVRLFCDTGEYIDKQVLVRHKDCYSASQLEEKIYFLGSNIATYDIAANTWELKGTSTIKPTSSSVASDSTYIYAVIDNEIKKFNPKTNVWSTHQAVTGILGDIFSDGNAFYVKDNATQYFHVPKFDGVATEISQSSGFDYWLDGTIYNGNIYSQGSAFRLYTLNGASPAVVTTLTNGSTSATRGDLVSNGTGDFYLWDMFNSVAKFRRYTGTTWTTLTSPPANAVTNSGGYRFAGATATKVYLYGVTAVAAVKGTLYEYDIAAGTWTQKLTNPYFSGTTSEYAYLLKMAAPVSCTITATAAAKQNTCSSNADATITLTAHSGASKVAYSLGSTFTGTYAGALDIMPAPFTIANKLPNPAAAQAYTIRLYCSETNFIDQTVTLQPKSVGCN